MNELPLQIQKAVRRYKPILTEGLTLYPVKVREYDEFQMARPALEALQASFPVAYLSMPLLQVYYHLDVVEPLATGAAPTRLFGCALLALSLALRLGEGMEAEKRILQWSPVVSREDPTRLKAVRALLNGEEMIEITPVQFQRLRPIIAAQNGVELEADNADPELVRAERELAEMNNAKLDVSLEQTISSVCALTGADEEEIDEWPIRKLTTRAASLQRALEYVVCGIGGAFGGFGKGGNPVPHPFYEQVERDSAALTDLASFAKGAAARATLGNEQPTG